MIIDIRSLSKHYSTGVKALNQLNMTVKKGEIFALLGPNGAGKSTLINILTTVSQPTSGAVKLFGEELSGKNRQVFQQKIACVTQRTSVDSYLTAQENMLFQSKLYGVEQELAEQRMKELTRLFDLTRYLTYPVGSYSGGVKRRLDIAINLISAPELLFLDEPTVGMDAISRRAMWAYIRKIKEQLGTTIFLTTHYLEEAEQLSDTICIMDKGKKLIQGSRQELNRYVSQQLSQVVFDEPLHCQQAAEILSNAGIVLAKQYELELLTAEPIEPIVRLLLEKKVIFSGIRRVKPSLEDVFTTILRKEETG
ncbi:ABC transporter ATP-binding protein [Candidatus Enterococcus clewellii]|uniref:ABC-2 type transport system ATP-binding protein n=1 Tax=Candidatus Enterococcus clewellii TaxID=1834193 RepID=A0A242K528_9ENTE|nr:ABC transporter ATP-binding protein [Enterococcus sp. 9E7_DIV0242]OTP14432.1 hypothetical protein A5888_002533 [Enterococcus sp. 9E7_DIV0242]